MKNLIKILRTDAALSQIFYQELFLCSKNLLAKIMQISFSA